MSVRQRVQNEAELGSAYTVGLHGEKLMRMRHAKRITVLIMCRQYWVCFSA
jgi:hypothetical protein